MVAGIVFDIPPLDLNEVAALAGVVAIAVPLMAWLFVAFAGRWFVTKKKYYYDQKKIAEAMEGHLKLITDNQNEKKQSDAKAHELLHAIKDLSREVSEQKQVTRDNTSATIRLSERMAVIEDRHEREGRG